MEHDLTDLLRRVPSGWSAVGYRGRRWGLTRAEHGRTTAIYAEELGGAGVISANIWHLDAGDQLRPCEQPAAAVLDFLAGFVIIPPTPTGGPW